MENEKYINVLLVNVDSYDVQARSLTIHKNS